MKNNYPITKLKILLEHDNANSNSAVIEKIINRSKHPDTDQKKYLVKRKVLDEDVKEGVFIDYILLKEYNNKISKPFEQPHRSKKLKVLFNN